MNGYLMLRTICYVLLSLMQDILKQQEITGISMKDCLSLLGPGLKYFNSLRTDENEPIYTYNDKYMRWFVRQAAYGSRVCAFNQ